MANRQPFGFLANRQPSPNDAHYTLAVAHRLKSIGNFVEQVPTNLSLSNRRVMWGKVLSAITTPHLGSASPPGGQPADQHSRTHCLATHQGDLPNFERGAGHAPPRYQHFEADDGHCLGKPAKAPIPTGNFGLASACGPWSMRTRNEQFKRNHNSKLYATALRPHNPNAINLESQNLHTTRSTQLA